MKSNKFKEKLNHDLAYLWLLLVICSAFFGILSAVALFIREDKVRGTLLLNLSCLSSVILLTLLFVNILIDLIKCFIFLITKKEEK